MKITFVLAIADLSGGVRVVSIYADRLKRRGHDVTIVVRPPPRRHLPRKGVLRHHRPGPARGGGTGPSHLDQLDVDVRYIDGHRPVTAPDVPNADVIVATWWETSEWIESFPASRGPRRTSSSTTRFTPTSPSPASTARGDCRCTRSTICALAGGPVRATASEITTSPWFLTPLN